jgi:hypothetical protein
MMKYVDAVVDLLVERTPGELISSLLVALALSFVLAGLFSVWRRKTSDAVLLLTCLALVVNLAGMLFSASYVRLSWIGQSGSERAFSPPSLSHHPGLPMGRPPSFLRDAFGTADADRDGWLSVDEAATAAAKFVKEADENGKGAVDIQALLASIHHRYPPPRGVIPMEPPPPPPEIAASEELR